jgi:hypothetical protein
MGRDHFVDISRDEGHRIDHREMGCEGLNWIEGLNIEFSG